MAKSISEEELQLRKRARRRLIGAIALVTIVAVFLPMVLDHEPKPVSQDINIQVPSPNSGAFTSKIVPTAPRAPEAAPATKPAAEIPPKSGPSAGNEPAASVPAATPPAYDTEAAPPKQAAPAQPKPAPKAPAASAPAAKTANQAKPDAAGGGFVVQVAALNDADKAKQMQQQIADAGVKSYTEVVPTKKGSVTRVRAGPFASRDEAEKVRDKLKGLGLNGNIVPKSK